MKKDNIKLEVSKRAKGMGSGVTIIKQRKEKKHLVHTRQVSPDSILCRFSKLFFSFLM